VRCSQTDQAGDAVIEVVEADVEVTRIVSGRFEPQPRRALGADGHQCLLFEGDQRGPLSELVHGQVAGGEDRDPQGGVDRVVAQRVMPEHGSVRRAAAHHDGDLVCQFVTDSDEPLLDDCRCCYPDRTVDSTTRVQTELIMRTGLAGCRASPPPGGG
jgi:hypothetical protein